MRRIKYLDSMERSLLEHIDELHREHHTKGWHMPRFLRLFFLYALFAIHRAWLILTTKPMHSFTELHPQNPNGEWPVSYVEHLHFCFRTRLYTLGSLFFLSASMIIVVLLAQLNDRTRPTYAFTLIQTPTTEQEVTDADSEQENQDTEENQEDTNSESEEEELGSDQETSGTPSSLQDDSGTDQNVSPSTFSSAFFESAEIVTILVTNTNSSGAGSFSNAINIINGLPGADSYIIELSASGTIDINGGGDIAPIEKQVFIENVSGGEIVLDGSLDPAGACIEFTSAAQNSSIEGITFENCTTAILVDQADGVTISSAADPVAISGGQDGIVIDDADNVTISSAQIGESDLSGTGMIVDGDGTVIESVEVTHAENGIEVLAAATNTTIRSSFIGVFDDGTGNGNRGNGISIAGSNTLVGGTESADGNTIVANGGQGVSVQNTSDTTIAFNTIGQTENGNGGTGISLSLEADDVATIENNTIEGNGDGGIFINGGSLHTITGNEIERNTGNGIAIESGATDTVIGGEGIGNSMIANTLNGVLIEGASTKQIEVTQNSFGENGLLPIDLSDGSNNAIASVVIDEATTDQVTGSGASAGAGGRVELYVEENDLLSYVGSDDTIAESGEWTVSISDDLADKEVFALLIDAQGNTSEFSEGVLVDTEEEDFSLSHSIVSQKRSATVTAKTSLDTTARIQYGTSPTRLTQKISSSSLKKTHIFSLEELLPDTTYYYRIIARNATNSTAQSAVREFSTKTTNPSVTSLEGDFSVTTEPENLLFQGSAEYSGKTQFRFFDVLAQKEFALCNTNEELICELPYTLSLGEYDIFFSSITDSGSVIESSQAHRFIVSKPEPTEILTTDVRSSDYLSRVVVDETVTIVGIQPKKSTLLLTVNGEKIPQKDILSTGEQSFSATVSLASLQREKDYLIEGRFVSTKTGDPVGEEIYYPFSFEFPPVAEPVVIETVDVVPGETNEFENEETLTPPEENPQQEEEEETEQEIEEEVVTPSEQEEEQEQEESDAEIRKRINTLLRTQLQIEAIQHILDEQGNVIREELLKQNADGQIILRNTRTVGLRPTRFLSFGNTNEVDILQISGVSDPFAKITLTIFSDPIVQVTEADEEGKWKIHVAVSDLPEGQHTAFLKAESQGVESDEIEIARFVVIQDETLSNTSWIFIINSIIAVCVLSILITVKIEHRKEQKRIREIRAQRKMITPQELVTELRKKQTEKKVQDDDSDDDLHSTLDI